VPWVGDSWSVIAGIKSDNGDYQMTVNATFWDAWAPYLQYLEDNLLDLEAINRLSTSVTDPVLVVGAGQGLVVEGLTRKGFCVDSVELSPVMIEYAKRRRGLELIEADAGNMPFDDRTYYYNATKAQENLSGHPMIQ
jgi:SAM-dependent methyltransferase